MVSFLNPAVIANVRISVLWKGFHQQLTWRLLSVKNGLSITNYMPAKPTHPTSGSFTSNEKIFNNEFIAGGFCSESNNICTVTTNERMRKVDEGERIVFTYQTLPDPNSTVNWDVIARDQMLCVMVAIDQWE